MKKILSTILILMVCCTSLLLVGCKNGKNGKIEFSTIPQISISREEAADVNASELRIEEFLKEITITVYDGDNKVVLNNISIFDAIEEHNAVLKNLTIETSGTRTATLSVLNASGSFDYTVQVL